MINNQENQLTFKYKKWDERKFFQNILDNKQF